VHAGHIAGRVLDRDGLNHVETKPGGVHAHPAASDAAFSVTSASA
jgi:hypothetical protein